MPTLPHELQPPPPFPAPPCCSAPRERAVDLLKRAREGDAPRCGGGRPLPLPGHVSCRVHAETPFWNSRKRVKDDHPVVTLSPTRSLHPRASEGGSPWPGRFVTGVGRCHQQAPQRLLPGRVELIRSSNRTAALPCSLPPPALQPSPAGRRPVPSVEVPAPGRSKKVLFSLLPSRVLFCALQRTRGDPSGDASRCGGGPP